MRLITLLGAWMLTGPVVAQENQPLEIPSTPFDFDSYRRTPLQARQSSSSWASRDHTDLQRALLSGEGGKKQDIATRAAALFPDPQEIPIRQDPEPLPSPNELTDEITVANHGETTKGQRDLLARSRVAERLNLSSMSDADYELYVAQYRAAHDPVAAPSGESLLRPMPTLMNTKTGGPPHAYSVSQAGVGVRAEPRSNENPFAELIQVFRLNQPVTKGSDPLPAPSSRLTMASTATPTPDTEKPTPTSEASPSGSDPKP